ncbi:type VII secretion protein EssC [Butyrivibrio sp. XB500-5]|uniref:type VII secretion protein EssC n=1 Tax=Butyrivibrio sp. XB500-5 TaxID=2364880 RepID=UPI000EA9FD42|nr:type VII secretion protein EssC [Butyrivibrio sp. XB500-5]RKM57765.1 type VII secretion protein EssC [Butyrivibrio sp. XB500-5]
MRNSNIESNALRYKLIVYGNKLYKETIIPEDVKTIVIGTCKEAQIRLPEKLYSEAFQITIEKQDKSYVMVCRSGNYILTDDGNKEYMHELEPGDRVQICYEGTDITAIRIDFSLDFGKVQDDYCLHIETGNTSVISIGGADCDIKINDPIIGSEKCVIRKEGNGYLVDASELRFGVEINGITWKGSAIKLENKQFLTIYGISFYAIDGELYTLSDGRVETNLKGYVIKEQNNQFKYPEFIKNVRLQYVQPEEKLSVIPPKAEAQQQSFLSLISMLPMFIMMFMMMGMRSRMYGGGSGGNSYMIMYGLMYGCTAGMSVVMFFVNRKKVKEQNKKRIEVYNEYLRKKDDEIKKEREEERVISQKMNVLPEEMISQIQNFDARLFEKRKGHKDYLDVPIGVGKIDAFNQVEFREQDELDTTDPLMEYPKELHDKYESIEQMPVVLHLKDVNAMGFVGDRRRLLSIARNIMLTLSGQHFFNDVKFYLLIHEEDVAEFEWTRWLQNIADMGIRNIMYDADSKKVILDKMYNELSAREGGGDGIEERKKSSSTHYVVFAYRSKELIEHPITNYVKRAKELGFTFLFFDEHKELLHEDCDELVYLDSEGNRGFIQETTDAVKMQGFEYPEITQKQATDAAIKLACVHINEISLESTLTKNISYFQLYNILTPYDLKVGERWASAKIYDGMAVPIGVDASGSKVCLDIHEKGHGPHGLVAGTTGAGKSELLQTYVLSMCTNFHPYEVGFIIIDFKGGGMANQFKKLPHLNGAITNIDGKQVNRSLMSIKAELMKRQRLFAEAEVNAIDSYIDLYKKGEVKIPLPHLILIVDEFAELKADQPDFMQELISAARIGRSLGVHLILATQKPAGVVNDQIWSNSRFKLCLKVQDKSDSNEVLKSPLAAEIREPGRCYLEVGNNEIFQLLQSAYSGAPAGVGVVDQTSKFDLSMVNLVGKRSIFYHQEPEKEDATLTQLDAVVDYIAEHCAKEGIEKLSPICLPPLEENIVYKSKDKGVKDTDVIVPIGIYDDPENQAQEVVSLNLTKENTFVIGSALSGKTNLIQTIVRGITDNYGADEVSLYIIDFASMILRNFASLSYVGGVVTIKDETMLRQLFSMINGMIDERQKAFADLGLSSFSSYREAGYKELPQVVVIMENYAALRSAYEDYEEQFITLCQDGLAVGISVIVTNPTASAIGFKILTNFGRKIAYYCNDSSQYGGLFDRCRLEPDEVAGRAITIVDGQIREFQTYLSFDAKKEIERIDKIKEYVKEINTKCGDVHAYRIPTIPEEVTEDYIEEHYDSQLQQIREYNIPIGISYSTIEPVYLQLQRSTLFSCMGTDESDRLAFIKSTVYRLNKYKDVAPTKLYIVDSVNRELSFAQDLDITAGYAITAGTVSEYIKEISDEVGTRYDEMENNPDVLFGKPMLILIINSPLAVDMISQDIETSQRYDFIVSKLRGYRACIMHSNLENTAITFKSGEILRQVSQEATHIMFENANMIKPVEIPLAFARKNSKKPENGDAFYIGTGVIDKIKTITS